MPLPRLMFDRLRPFVLPLIALALIVAAGWIIHALTHHVHLADIRAAVAAVTPWRIGVAVLLTAVSFTALAATDVVAVRSVGAAGVPIRTAALAGALGYAVSNVLGFGVVTGGALRHRVYAGEGLDAAHVARVTVTSYFAFWLGIIALLGVALLLDPTAIGLAAVGTEAKFGGGVVLLGIVAALLLWLNGAPRQIALRGWTASLPSARIALILLALGSLDIAVSAGTLYALLPADLTISWPYFLVAYVAALAIGTLSHAPGGLGPFEATIIAAMGPKHSVEMIAALFLYRLVYNGLPFALSVVGLAIHEAIRARRTLTATAAETARIVAPIVPAAAAATAFIAGLVLFAGGVLPATELRMNALQAVLPLPFVELSHLLGSVVGVLLIILALGLMRRFHSAWVATLALLGAGAVTALARGAELESAVLMGASALLLLAFRDAFYRRADLSELRLSPAWMAMATAGVAAALWLGFFSYRHVAYGHDLWWQFEWSGDAPRFLRASVAASALLVCAAFFSFINRAPAQRTAADPITDELRRIVASSPRAAANVALLGDKHFLFDKAGSAFLMYGEAGRSRIALGDPVGDAAAASELIWAFREQADRAGSRPIYYAVGPENLPTYLDLGLSVLKIGEVARVDLERFSLAGKKAHDFRYAARKAEKDGLAFAVIPATEVHAHLAGMRSVSDAWLASKAGHEKGFSLGYFDEAYLRSFDCAVLRNAEGIQAFANIWRGAQREEMSVDLMRHRPQRSGILMDALFAKLLLYAKDEGYRWFNLGAAPLAGLVDHPLASRWNRAGTFLYRHAEGFYHFEGLRAFKQKFDPVWVPQYVCARGGFQLPASLFDVTALISGGKLGLLSR